MYAPISPHLNLREGRRLEEKCTGEEEEIASEPPCSIQTSRHLGHNCSPLSFSAREEVNNLYYDNLFALFSALLLRKFDELVILSFPLFNIFPPPPLPFPPHCRIAAKKGGGGEDRAPRGRKTNGAIWLCNAVLVVQYSGISLFCTKESGQRSVPRLPTGSWTKEDGTGMEELLSRSLSQTKSGLERRGDPIPRQCTVQFCPRLPLAYMAHMMRYRRSPWWRWRCAFPFLLPYEACGYVSGL